MEEIHQFFTKKKVWVAQKLFDTRRASKQMKISFRSSVWSMLLKVIKSRKKKSWNIASITFQRIYINTKPINHTQP